MNSEEGLAASVRFHTHLDLRCQADVTVYDEVYFSHSLAHQDDFVVIAVFLCLHLVA